MRIFVIGRNGQIARSLIEGAVGRKGIQVDALSPPELDITKPETVYRSLEKAQPDLVVNPAAFTAVDEAEEMRDMAFAINRDGAGVVAKAAAANNIPLIHLSTDYVFDGRKGSPYLESDPVGPINVYGRSKLEGELAVQQEQPKHIILRTAWVYAPFGTNFVRTMLRLASQRDSIRVVDDQEGCPTYAPDIAAAILTIAERMQRDQWPARYFGITNLAGPERITWCNFARAIMTRAALHGMPCARIDPIGTAEYSTRAARPAYSQLATDRLASLFGIHLPPMDESLGHCMLRIADEIKVD
jgi:dTDP-4-dehydrorhamnose reductase